MYYNQRTDFQVSHETAFGWWKAFSSDEFNVRGVHGSSNDAKLGEPAEGNRDPNGLWVILTPKFTELAGVLAVRLEDGSGKYGLAVLWYDREKASRLARFLNASKLSLSKRAVLQIEKIVLQQGGRLFPLPEQPVKNA